MKPTFFTLFATLLLAGCTTPKMNTPSGQNEVTIQASRTRVQAELVNTMVNRGYEIRTADELVIVGERDAGPAAMVLFGTTYNPQAKIRARLNLIPIDNSVRVIGRGYLVGGNGVESPLAPHASSQAWLEEVRIRCESN